MLVEQDEHRLDFRLYEPEGLAHVNGLIDMFFIQEFLTCGMCRTATAIVVVYPRSRIGPSIISMPSCWQLALLVSSQRHIATYLCHFGGQFALHRRIVLPVLFKGVDGASLCS